MKLSLNLWKALTIGLLCTTILVLFPFLFDVNFSGIIAIAKNVSFINTLQTTLLNAIVTAIVLVLFGFTGAILLLNVSAFSFIGKNLGLLIIPISLGNLSIAFIFKLIWGNSYLFSSLAQGSSFNKLGFLLVLELYQFCLLFVYLFWMQLQNINSNRLNFAIATNFSFYQKLKDIYLPHTRNLWLLLSAMACVFSFYE